MHGNARLSDKQEKAIRLLVEGYSIVDAAKEIGSNESTVRRWRKDPDFQQAYLEERKRALDLSFMALQSKFGRAVKTLDHHLDDGATIPRDQIKAAEVVLDKTIQVSQLKERIEELEIQVAELEAQLTASAQDDQDMVYFNLRDLTADERMTLRNINACVADRKAV
jgi:hypothetical protein